MRKVWDIHGGVHPPENKTQSNQTPIASISLPSEIILPLNQHIGAPAHPIVDVGQRVLKGEKIADPIGVVSTAVHASTSGEVIAIEERQIAHSSGLTAPCIVIHPDGHEAWAELSPCEDYRQMDRNDLIDLIRHAGIAGMGGAGFPSAVKLHPRSEHVIDTLILNGTECEPYITADDVIMRERAAQIVQGAQLIAYILHDPNTILIGIEDNKPEAIAAMQDAAKGTKVEIVSFPTKYPSGGEKQLIQILTGKEVPSGGLPAEIGVVVQNVGTAAAVYRAIQFGEPLISRVTTVVGESLTTQQNIDVLIGTPIEHVLREHGFIAEQSARLIIGGPMMGFAVEKTTVPVIKTTNCILAPSKQEMPEQPPAQPCIRCGMCAQACPASLLPQQLFWFSQSEDFDKLTSHSLFDCIECGACSFVCPSNIPLVQYYRHSKATMKQLAQKKHKSDRSRERFEFRQERLAKSEAEKEAKRIARRKAAEEAKKKLAKKKANETADATSEVTSKSAEAVIKAVEKAHTATVDPEKLRAKLERALSSAKSRVERATKSLNDAKQEGDQSRIDTLEARLKQADLKVTEAQTKLNEFNQQSSHIESTGQNAKNKIALSPVEKQQKNLETLKKRLDVAKEKLAEAEAADAPTVEALKNGITKLESKLSDAENALAATQPNAGDEVTQEATPALSAAELAIEKAKRKSAEQAAMSDDEKHDAQKASLEARLEKAKARLKKAIDENNDNIDAFKLGVEKLESKLQEL